jgi:hypothetical protein
MGVPAGKMEFRRPELVKISDVIWDMPPSFKHGMRVPARIIATRKLIDAMDDQVYDQISNVATLPGIQKYAFCMPDGHSGYVITFRTSCTRKAVTTSFNRNFETI